ncbi:hypothetical protein GJ496_009322 [Pomphorhynchus laevis]|nr:hypothetical protein GJ496_009322 [Pomphorhynchus laevis]
MLLYIYCFLLAILIIALIFLFKYQTWHIQNSTAHLLLIGPRDAGKSRLFIKLTMPFNESIQTVTSQKHNVALLKWDQQRKCRVVDIPGHGSVFQSEFNQWRMALMNTWYSKLCAFVLVINHDKLHEQIREFASHLVHVFQEFQLAKTERKKVLVFVAQSYTPAISDSNEAISLLNVQKQIDKEINTFLKSKEFELSETSQKANSQYKQLSKYGKSEDYINICDWQIGSIDDRQTIEELKEWIQTAFSF